MKIEVDDNNELLLMEVYNDIVLKTNSGEIIYICMRDSGFEFTYQGVPYEAKRGIIKKIDE